MVAVREQLRSKTFRKGEPIDHAQAVLKTVDFSWKNRKDKRWGVHANKHIPYPEGFIVQEKLRDSNRDHFEHYFDWVMYDEHGRIFLFGEMNGRVGYNFKAKKTKNRYEIAAPTKHENQIQKENDALNKGLIDYLKEHPHDDPEIKVHPDAVYFVLMKEEVNGDASDPDRIKNTNLHLWRELQPWMKTN